MLNEIKKMLSETKKFVKNSPEILIALGSNQLWHKMLKQNRLFATGVF
jgi:hypothetical protein